MSLQLNFEPHGWYMEFAIADNRQYVLLPKNDPNALNSWAAYIDNGNTYHIDNLYAPTLTMLKHRIKDYHLRHHNGYGERIAKRRLEYLRGELREARLSYGEIAELQSLINYIDPSDTELLEAAGIPEHENSHATL